MRKSTYHIEVTDTFAGEANYSWKRQWLVKATSARGAITKLAKREGGGFRKSWGNDSETTRYNLAGAHICAFVTYLDDSALSSFNGVAYL